MVTLATTVSALVYLNQEYENDKKNYTSTIGAVRSRRHKRRYDPVYMQLALVARSVLPKEIVDQKKELDSLDFTADS